MRPTQQPFIPAVAMMLASIPFSAAQAQPDSDSKRIEVAQLPLVRTIDERFQSYQIGMSHLTGGDTWISYDAMEESDIQRDYAGDLAPIREPRMAINLEDTPAQLDLPGSVELYAMTAPELQSRTVLLNGEALELGADDSLPAITSSQVSGENLSLAPTSVNFIVLPDADNPGCSG